MSATNIPETQPLLPLNARCQVCNAIPGEPCLTPEGELKNGTHIVRGEGFGSAADECEAALDLDLSDGEKILSRHGFVHDGYGRDANTRLWVSEFIQSLRAAASPQAALKGAE